MRMSVVRKAFVVGVLVLTASAAAAQETDTIFPNGFDALGGTLTDRQTVVSLNASLIGTNLINAELVTQSLGLPVAVVGEAIVYAQTILDTLVLGFGAGIGGRFQFGQSLDGLYAGGVIRFYRYSRDITYGLYTADTSFSIFGPTAQAGYRISLWDRLSLASGLSLGVTNTTTRYQDNLGLNVSDSTLATYAWWDFMVGILL